MLLHHLTIFWSIQRVSLSCYLFSFFSEFNCLTRSMSNVTCQRVVIQRGNETFFLINFRDNHSQLLTRFEQVRRNSLLPNSSIWYHRSPHSRTHLTQLSFEMKKNTSIYSLLFRCASVQFSLVARSNVVLSCWRLPSCYDRLLEERFFFFLFE